MSVTNRTICKDPVVSVLLCYLYPSQLVQTTFPNQVNGQKLKECVVVGRELRKINQKMQTAIIVHHEAFKNGDDFLEVHAVERWFKLQVGALELIFTPEEVSDLDTAMGEEEEGPEMPAIILQTANASAQVNVDKVLSLPGMEVDDDCKPAPENIPQSQAVPDGQCMFGEWGHGRFCNRMIASAQNQTQV